MTHPQPKAPSVSEAKTSEEGPDVLLTRLTGRARWLRERGRIKDAELMEGAYAALNYARMALGAAA